jgi:hypothetical protein
LSFAARHTVRTSQRPHFRDCEPIVLTDGDVSVIAELVQVLASVLDEEERSGSEFPPGRREESPPFVSADVPTKRLLCEQPQNLRRRRERVGRK